MSPRVSRVTLDSATLSKLLGRAVGFSLVLAASAAGAPTEAAGQALGRARTEGRAGGSLDDAPPSSLALGFSPGSAALGPIGQRPVELGSPAFGAYAIGELRLSIWGELINRLQAGAVSSWFARAGAAEAMPGCAGDPGARAPEVPAQWRLARFAGRPDSRQP